ncbi:MULTISPECIES: DUF7661 family protein [Roseateles]|uniref:DUF7661 domain-containing protein n=1 Tax=Pelomonas caseinilytica TaxID=2906763 RepID=A0ABS8XHP2_9BURK|nr:MULTISPECIES: hypothetical protein [unclassified Roseateles]MCE4538750.1 hypothetical protein [Pelomonas sp. P7]HEV6968312.1 hypothetical protein [Roseateles sp.]
MISERFHILGGLFDIERTGGHWSVLAVGHDGQRSPAHFAIPEFVADDELEQYLRQLFEDEAAGNPGGIVRVQR